VLLLKGRDLGGGRKGTRGGKERFVQKQDKSFTASKVFESVEQRRTKKAEVNSKTAPGADNGE